jgi:AraC-like DNA-binding protein
MDPGRRLLLHVAESSLSFEYQTGDVTRVTWPHSTGWRTLPSLVTAQISGYAAVVHFEGRADVTVRDGEAICTPPGVRHKSDMTTRRPGTSRWSHTVFRILDGVDVFAILTPPPRLAGAAARAIGDINAELAALSRREEPQLHQVFRHKALGMQLIAVVTEASTVSAHGLDLLQGARRLAPVLARINADLSADLGREELARMANLSASRFHTLFAEALGAAPGEYVQRARMQKAQQLLIGTDLSVAEIGRQVGHADPFHFSRIFRKRCGTSPKAYREQARRGAM